MLQMKADQFRTDALYERAQDSCRNAKETWALLQEKARTHVDDPQAWQLEQQSWQAFRAAAGCERTAWELFQEELTAARETARTVALGQRGVFEQTIEERTQRAIERGRQARPAVTGAPPLPVVEPDTVVAAADAAETIPTFEATWQVRAPMQEALAPAAPEVLATAPPASSDMVARIRSLLEEEAAMAVTSVG